MNQKKNTKMILILIIILSIVILVGGCLFLFLGTDLLKNDKDLFFKYAMQLGDSKQGMIENSLTQYMDKKNQTPYSNQGSFKIEVTSKNQQQYESLKDFDITFSGQVDKQNSKNLQEISFNYSDSVKFPINYKQIGNTIGLQTDYVGSKFVAVETDKLNNLSASETNVAGGTISGVQQIEKITQIPLTAEELVEIQNRYVGAINEQLNEEKFSKVEELDRNGYRLTLTGEELKNILVKLLETLKNDQTTLEKINEYLKAQRNSASITVRDIEQQIEELNNNTDLGSETIEITIYEKNRKVTAILVKTNNIIIDIEKENTNKELSYHITLKPDTASEETQVTLDIAYTDISDNQKIKETYTFGYKTPELEAKYIFENNVDFTVTNNIEDFTEENTMLLTNYEPEQVSSFLQAATQRISQVNEQQMEQLGLEVGQNPLLVGIINPLLEISIQSSAISTIGKSNLSQEEIESFNQKFELYQSTNLQGVTVKGLLSTISLNNETKENQQIKEINFNGEEYEATEQNIAFIKEDVATEKSYRVEFEKDSNTGIIYRAVINEK